MKKDFLLSNKLTAIIIAVFLIMFSSYILHYFISKIPVHFIFRYRIFCILLILVSIFVHVISVFIRNRQIENSSEKGSNRRSEIYKKRLFAYSILLILSILSIYCILALNLSKISEGFYFTSTVGWMLYVLCYCILTYINSSSFAIDFSETGGNKELQALKTVYSILVENKYFICSFESFLAFYYDKPISQSEKIIWIHVGSRKDDKTKPNMELLCKFVIIAKRMDITKSIYSQYKSLIEKYYMFPKQESIEITRAQALSRLIDSDAKRLKTNEHVGLFIELFDPFS